MANNEMIYKKSVAIYCVYLMISASIVWAVAFGVAQEACPPGEERNTIKIGSEDIVVQEGPCAGKFWIDSLVDSPEMSLVKLEKVSHNGKDILILTDNSDEYGPSAFTFEGILDGVEASGKLEEEALNGINKVATVELENGKKLSLPYDWNKVPEDIKSIEIDKEKGIVTYTKENGAKVVVGQEGVFLAKSGSKTLVKGYKIGEESQEIDLGLGSTGEINFLDDGKISYSGKDTTLTFKDGLKFQVKDEGKSGSVEFSGIDSNNNFLITNSKVKNDKENYEINVDKIGLFFGDELKAPAKFKKKYLTLSDSKMTGNLNQIISDNSVVEFTNFGDNDIDIDSKISRIFIEGEDPKEIEGSFTLGKNNKAIFKKGTAEEYKNRLIIEVKTNADSSFTPPPTDPQNLNVPTNTRKKPTVPGVINQVTKPNPGQKPNGTTTTPTPIPFPPGGSGGGGGGGGGGLGGMGGWLKWGLIIGGAILAAMLALGGGDSEDDPSNSDSYPEEEEEEYNTNRPNETTGRSDPEINNTNQTRLNESSEFLDQNRSCECDFRGCSNCPNDNCFNCKQN
jgi:hypothetical protein